MYQTACGLRERGGWEMAPSEFWHLSPAEWWALWDINVGEQLREQASTMDRLKRIYYESKAKE